MYIHWPLIAGIQWRGRDLTAQALSAAKLGDIVVELGELVQPDLSKDAPVCSPAQIQAGSPTLSFQSSDSQVLVAASMHD